MQEKVGRRSLRQDANQTFGIVTDEELQSLELALGNLCNNACIMCNSSYSTRWVADEIALGDRPVRHQMSDLEGQLKGIDLSKIEHIKLIGGETFMYQPQIMNILDRAQNLRSLHLTTNATLIANDRLAARLDEVESLNINVSIDAYGSRNEYIRFGSKWDETENITKRLIDRFGLKRINIATVVQIPNVSYLHELEDWLDEIGSPHWFIDTLVQPRHLDVRILSPKAKAYTLDRLGLLRNESVKSVVSNYILFETLPGSERFWANIDRLDKLRNQDFRTQFAEIAELID